jgi:hypothetical protein
MAAENPWFTGQGEVTTFELDELLGTKLRALYQRRKGRDLFDLWLSIDHRLVDPQRVVDCFGEYMQREQHPVSRAEFEQNLHGKQTDPAFMDDIRPLLRTEVQYDPVIALARVQEALISILPGDPWRGSADQTAGDKKKRRGRKRP